MKKKTQTSTSLIVSLLRLQTQSKLSDPELTKNKGLFVYPASPTLLKKIVPKETYEKYIANRSERLAYSGKIYDERLRPYQNEDVDFMVRAKSSGNFNQQRLGKTPETLVAAREIGFKTLLIIAPKSTLYSWKKECETWIGIPAYVVVGKTKARRAKAYKEEKIILSSYETASLDYDLYPNLDIIVIDEVDRLRNFKGQRSKRSPTFTKNILQLSYKAKYKIALSGTPSPNYSYNIFAILHFMFPTSLA